MNPFADQVLQRLKSGSLLSSDYYSGQQTEALLDLRDADSEFDSTWANLSEQIEDLWQTRGFEDCTSSTLDEIRRTSFMLVSRATTQGEIAGYVSDDLELIVKAKLLAISHPFLDQLWHCYESGCFPYTTAAS
jgi:Tfp pilus assembly protein PilV